MLDFHRVFIVSAHRIPDTIKAIEERGITEAYYYQGHILKAGTHSIVRVEVPNLSQQGSEMLKKLWEQYNVKLISEYVIEGLT